VNVIDRLATAHTPGKYALDCSCGETFDPSEPCGAGFHRHLLRVGIRQGVYDALRASSNAAEKFRAKYDQADDSTAALMRDALSAAANAVAL